MVEKLTPAQRSLVQLVIYQSPRAITRQESARRGMLKEFERCLRAGLIQSAGYEASVNGDEWLESPAGRLALALASRADGGERG